MQSGPGFEAFARGDDVFGLKRFRQEGADAEVAVTPGAELARRPPAIERVLPLAEARPARERNESGLACGKIVPRMTA